jgi:uncharacterized protein (TIGR02246 family)
MSRIAVLGFAIVVVVWMALPGRWSVNAQGTSTLANANEESAARSVLEAQLAAWAAGDGAAFGATVTEDSDLIAFDGTHLVGRQAIAAFMQKQFDTVLAGTQVVAEPVRTRVINDEIVVMITEGGVIFPGEAEVPAEHMSIQTFVLTKENDRWLVDAFQNTRLAPAPA